MSIRELAITIHGIISIMKNISVILIIMLLGVVAYYVGNQSAFMSKQHNFELQEKCSKQAHEIELRDDDWSRKHGLSNSSIYYNHYNMTLNKCFITTTTIGPGENQEFLSDAFEEKTYGSYDSVIDKSSSLLKVTRCEVTLTTGEDKQCNSWAEFNVLIKKYMEQ